MGRFGTPGRNQKLGSRRSPDHRAGVSEPQDRGQKHAGPLRATCEPLGKTRRSAAGDPQIAYRGVSNPSEVKENIHPWEGAAVSGPEPKAFPDIGWSPWTNRSLRRARSRSAGVWHRRGAGSVPGHSAERPRTCFLDKAPQRRQNVKGGRDSISWPRSRTTSSDPPASPPSSAAAAAASTHPPSSP